MRRTRKPRLEEIWTRMSASKLNSLTTCSLRGSLEFVLNEPGPIHPMTALGQALHYVFYLFFRPHPRTKRYPYLKLEALQGTWKGLWWGAIPKGDTPARHGFSGRHTPPQDVAWEFDGQPGVVFASGQKILKTFFENFDAVRHNGRVHWIERRFLVQWHGLNISGIMDRVDFDPDGVIILDYKSKRYPDHLLETGVQMSLYQLAYELGIRPRIPGHPPLKGIHIYDYRSGTIQVAPLRPAREYGMLLRYMLEASDYLRGVFTGRMPSHERMLEFEIFDPADMLRGDTRPKLPRGEHCTWCSYYKQCRQWELGQLPIARMLLQQKFDQQAQSVQPNQIRLPFDDEPVVQVGSRSIEVEWRRTRLTHVQGKLPLDLQ